MTNRPYDHPDWPAIRQQVLARDGHRCKIKRPRCTGTATEVDHVVPWRDGGPALDPANLQAVCKSCNVGKRNSDLAKTAREARGDTTPTRKPHIPAYPGQKPELPEHPTRAEWLDYYGYDWPGPPGGFADEQE